MGILDKVVGAVTNPQDTLRQAAQQAGVNAPRVPQVRVPSIPNPVADIEQKGKQIISGVTSLFGSKAKEPDAIIKGKGADDYYRVDVDKKGQTTIQKMDINGVTPQMRQDARTPAQLSKELSDSNTPAKMNALVKYVNDTDTYISGLTGKPGDTDITVQANGAATRSVADTALRKELKDADKIPDATQKHAVTTGIQATLKDMHKLDVAPAALTAYDNLMKAAPSMAPPTPPGP